MYYKNILEVSKSSFTVKYEHLWNYAAKGAYFLLGVYDITSVLFLNVCRTFHSADSSERSQC